MKLDKTDLVKKASIVLMGVCFLTVVFINILLLQKCIILLEELRTTIALVTANKKNILINSSLLKYNKRQIESIIIKLQKETDE